jgi:tetratricopeptide (TPR) repeat protein
MQTSRDPSDQPLPLPQWRTDVAVQAPPVTDLGFSPKVLYHAIRTDPDRFAQLWRVAVCVNDVRHLQRAGALAASAVGREGLGEELAGRLVLVGVLAATRLPDRLDGFDYPFLRDDLGLALRCAELELELAGERDGADQVLEDAALALGEVWGSLHAIALARGELVPALEELVEYGAVAIAGAIVEALDRDLERPDLALRLAPRLRAEGYGSAADRLLTRALERHGPRSDLLRCRAATRRRLGNAELAVRDACEALALDPTDPRSVTTLRPLIRHQGRGDLLELLERLTQVQAGARVESNEQSGSRGQTRELLELVARILSGAGRTDLSSRMLDEWMGSDE